MMQLKPTKTAQKLHFHKILTKNKKTPFAANKPITTKKSMLDKLEKTMPKQLEQIRKYQKMANNEENTQSIKLLMKRKLINAQIEYKKKQINHELLKNGQSPGYHYLKSVLEQMLKEKKLFGEKKNNK